MTMIVPSFVIPTQLHQLSCISSSQVRWMHFDKMLKCRNAHQQWYICLQEASFPTHTRENPDLQHGHCWIIIHSLNPTSIHSTKIKGNGIRLPLWWPNWPCSNFCKKTFIPSRFCLQKTIFCSKSNNLLPWASASLNTLSYSTTPSFAKC